MSADIVLGLDTSTAYAELKRFKAAMVTELKDVVASVTVDAKVIKAAAGATGGSGAGSGFTPQLGSQIAAALAPAVDELAKAAAMLTAAAKVTKIERESSEAATVRRRARIQQNRDVVDFKANLSEGKGQDRAEQGQQYQDYQAQLREHLAQVRAAQAQEVAEFRAASAELAAAMRDRQNQQLAEYRLGAAELAATERAAQSQQVAEFRAASAEMSARRKAEQAQQLTEYRMSSAEAAAAAKAEASAAAKLKRDMQNQQVTSFKMDVAEEKASDVAARAAARKVERAEINATKAAMREYNAVANEGHAALRGLAGSMGAMWATYGSVVPLVAAAALGTALTSTLSVGKDVEYQLGFVSALSDGAAVSITKFGDALKGSMATPVEAAQAMRGLAQNGLSVGESLRALPSILSLATAGELSLQDAALGATGVMAAFGLSVNDLGHIGDVFAKAAAISNTSVQQMVESMKQASQVGDEFHVTLEDTAAALATLAQRNIVGTAAGTAFRNMMTELAAPSKKAREAMAQLGLSVYDSEKQLLSMPVVLDKLKATVIGLNEQSKIAFLGDMFGERGAKAVNALLTDLDEFKAKQKEIAESSKDFTKSVTDALGETTQGKLKHLMSEFEMSAVQAFNNSKGAAGGFINELRLIATSGEFQQVLDGLTRGLVGLARLLLDNANAISIFVEGFVGFKVLEAAIASITLLKAGLMSIGPAAKIAQVAIGFLGAELATVLGFVTGGLSIVAAAVASYYLLRDSTTEAGRAQQEMADATRLANQASEANLGILSKQIEYNLTYNQALRDGKSIEDARRVAQAGEAGNTVATLKQKQADALAQVMRSKSYINDGLGITGADRTAQMSAADNYSQISKALDQAQLTQAMTQVNEYTSAAKKAGETVRRWKEELVQLKAQAKGKDAEALKGAVDINDTWAQNNPVAAQMLVDAQRKKFENHTYTPSGVKGDDGHNAELARVLTESKNTTAEIEQQIKFRQELDAARYDPKLFGDYIATVLAEQRAIRGTTELVAAEKAELIALMALKSRPEFQKPGAQAQVDDAMASSSSKLRQHMLDLNQQVAVSQIRQDNAGVLDNASFKKQAALAASKSGLDRDKESESFDKKALSSGDAAAQAARLQVEANYRELFVKLQEQLNQQQGLQAVQADRFLESLEAGAAVNIADTQALAAGVLASDAKASSAAQLLALLRQQEAVQKGLSADNARSLAENAQTAGYGWKTFWEDYTQHATTNAQAVRDIMKTTTDSMSNSFSNFVTTGKFGFKSLAASILSEASKLLANKVMAQFLSMAVSMIGSFASAGASSFAGVGAGAGAGTGAGAFNGSAGGGVASDIITSANGNVVGPYGAAPLRKYATGGIATGPQRAVFGEGSRPEAYVPLQDGRTIPVTVQGMGGGNGAASGPSSVTVHIHSDGKSKVETDSSGKQGAMLGEMIHASVREVIAKEQRQGGLLYR